jgi:rhodanese-related sulfurtransferase
MESRRVYLRADLTAPATIHVFCAGDDILIFLEFLTEQWPLASAWAVAVILLLIHEGKRGGATVSPQQLVSLVNTEHAAVVDLRDAAEFRKGHIVDAINVPYAKLNEQAGQLEKLRERPIVLICKMGQYAGAAGKQLRAKGFTKVYRLRGGIGEWQGAQLPLIKG